VAERTDEDLHRTRLPRNLKRYVHDNDQEIVETTNQICDIQEKAPAFSTSIH
jgi:hypothetical protein